MQSVVDRNVVMQHMTVLSSEMKCASLRSGPLLKTRENIIVLFTRAAFLKLYSAETKGFVYKADHGNLP